MLKVGYLILQSNDPHIYGQFFFLIHNFKEYFYKVSLTETWSQQTKTKCKNINFTYDIQCL